MGQDEHKKRSAYKRLRRVGMTSFMVMMAMGLSTVSFLVVLFSVRIFNAVITDTMDQVFNVRAMIATVFALLFTVGATAALAWSLMEFLRRTIISLTDALNRPDETMEVRDVTVPFRELRLLRVAVMRAVTRLQRENRILRQVAYTDARTGLPNLTSLEAVIGKYLPQASYDAPVALIVLDIDNYMRACERIGPLLSEPLLAEAGKRLKQALDALEGSANEAVKDAMLATTQADEFGLFLPHAKSRELVSTIARAIRMSFNEPFTIAGQQIALGVSGGIVMAPEDADTSQKLFRHAELALRQARSESGSGFRYFSPRLNRVARGRYMLESELRDAIANNEFQTYFQPKIDFRTGEIVGAEALARWIRPNGKVISPNTFIPLAEETGLVTKIGEQVLESACRSARQWGRLGHNTSVAVNVSPRQFQTTDLVELVLGTLKRTGLAPNRLELEITESMAVSEPEKVSRVMRPLRLLGIKLAIDDFGTGHSNLSILTQMQFDVFKIDRQFVSALENEAQAPAIVEMILAMAETLQLKTVAEGVETELQADFLRRRGCSMAQGFLYSAGLPQNAFIEFLANWNPKLRRLEPRKAG